MGLIEQKQKIFYRKTKKGNILKIVREHYIRDDVWCGHEECTECKGDNNVLQQLKQSGSSLINEPHHIVIDTNVALHQIDFLSQDPITNVIVPQTVVQEVRHRSLPICKRLRDLIDCPPKHFYTFSNEHHSDCYIERNADESANDRNDRAIRVLCWWYNAHLHPLKQNVILLTNDINNRDKARQMDVQAYTVHEYVSSLTNHPELLDIVAHVDEGEEEEMQSCLHSPHWSTEAIRSALKTGKVSQGLLKTSRNNYLEANVMVGGGEQTVLIQGRAHLNRALHDDMVAIELLPKSLWSTPFAVMIEQKAEEEEGETEDATNTSVEPNTKDSKSKGEKQPTGKVVGVIRRKWRQYCGIIRKNDIAEATRHLFIPADRRIPFIRIETRQAEHLHDKRIIVAIDSWPRDSKNPKGHFVRVIGKIGDKETENEVVLLEHDCPHTKFSEAVLNCLPKMPWTITEKDVSEREDLRHLDICSVDPIGCTDIDDALHCKPLQNGNFEVGVHIADVAHFIRPNTAIDQEAQHRSTSVYLTNRRIDMVPELLSTNLCSLRSDGDRFAFSVIWEMTPKAHIVSSRFMKSIIRSRAEFSYEEAQHRIDDSKQKDNLTKSLRSLNKLAKYIKQRRIDAGALVLASMEVKFHMDPDTDTVVDIVAKQHLETMSMIEEFMLLANVTAAETTLKHFPSCALLRRHPAPPASNFEPLLLAAKSQGIQVDVTSNKTLADSLNAATRDNNPFFNSMLRIMTTRSMMQALYFCCGTLEEPEFYHYGLATPCYTHFTSPIRRYADIIVHRLLAVIIDKDITYPELLDPKKCTELTQHINYRHKMAQYASRASNVITAIDSLRGKVNDYDAYILFLHKNAIQVLVPTIGQQLTLYLDNHIRDSEKQRKEQEKALRSGLITKEDFNRNKIDISNLPTFEFNEQELYVKCGDLVLRPFDELKIQVSVDASDVQHQKVRTKLVAPIVNGFTVPPVSKRQADDSKSIDLKATNKKKKNK